MIRRKEAFSIVELLVAMGILSVMLTMAMLMLRSAGETSRKVTGNEACSLQMKKAERMLEMDLIQGKYSCSNMTTVPASLNPAAADGDALWFLSAVDPPSGQVVDSSGTPTWQRNILYYLVVPQGDGCAGGVGPAGLDDRCPHKVLIRKVVDRPGNPEPFISDMSAWLTRPNGLDISAMRGETDVESVSIVARDLLTFFVQNQTDVACEIRVNFQACNYLDAARYVAVGGAPLSSDRHTMSISMSVFPKN